MRWTAGQTGNAPVAARSPRQQAPSRVDLKVFQRGARRLQSLWHHDIDAEVTCAQLLLQAQGEALYLCIMYFVANFLSSMDLDVGSRSPLGQTSGALFFLRRSYDLKITVSAANLVSGIIATIFMAIGERSGLPYLYLPWLVNTMRGMAFCEGPALVGIAYILIPCADLSASCFLFITLFLYVEELCLWNEVFNNFRSCWTDYNKKRNAESRSKLSDKSKKSEQERTNPVEQKTSVIKTASVKSFIMSGEPCLTPFNEPEFCMTLLPSSSTLSGGFIEGRRPRGSSCRTRYTNVTG